MILKLIRNALGSVIVFFDWLTRPTGVKREAAEQARVETEAKQLSLYQFHACPFCVKTRRAIHRLNLPIEMRDAAKDETHREALRAGGGRVKVPCLRIDEGEQTQWMYESNEIIGYLEKRFPVA